ncbi:Uncharacterised protein [uncultured Clostridium sp.]|nr:Uncharacterised protein [uncultured Clostridium sp.]
MPSIRQVSCAGCNLHPYRCKIFAVCSTHCKGKASVRCYCPYRTVKIKSSFFRHRCTLQVFQGHAVRQNVLYLFQIQPALSLIGDSNIVLRDERICSRSAVDISGICPLITYELTLCSTIVAFQLHNCRIVYALLQDAFPRHFQAVADTVVHTQGAECVDHTGAAVGVHIGIPGVALRVGKLYIDIHRLAAKGNAEIIAPGKGLLIWLSSIRHRNCPIVPVASYRTGAFACPKVIADGNVFTLCPSEIFQTGRQQVLHILALQLDLPGQSIPRLQCNAVNHCFTAADNTGLFAGRLRWRFRHDLLGQIKVHHSTIIIGCQAVGLVVTGPYDAIYRILGHHVVRYLREVVKALRKVIAGIPRLICRGVQSDPACPGACLTGDCDFISIGICTGIVTISAQPYTFVSSGLIQQIIWSAIVGYSLQACGPGAIPVFLRFSQQYLGSAGNIHKGNDSVYLGTAVNGKGVCMLQYIPIGRLLVFFRFPAIDLVRCGKAGITVSVASS